MNKKTMFMLVFLISLIVVLLVLLTIFKYISSDEVSAFLGILIGSGLSSFIEYRISEDNRRHQLRMASLEKRLEIHQHAYTLWRKLLFANKKNNEILATRQFDLSSVRTQDNRAITRINQ